MNARHSAYILLCGLLLAPALPRTMRAQSFSTFVSSLYASSPQRQQQLADSFYNALPQTPYVENDTLCHILYRGSAQTVSLAGDMNSWSDTRSLLTRLGSTTLWYRSDRFEHDARLDYKLVVDGNWILDPRNPLTMAGGFGPNSELRMPRYQEPGEVLSNTGVPRGRIIDTTLSIPELGNQRNMRIYLPPSHGAPDERYPLVLFHDGLDYQRLGNAATVLDNLIAARAIPPCIALFIPAVDRTEEYAGSQLSTYARHLAEVLLPAIDARYNTRTDAASRVLIGSSNGGNIALYMAMSWPQLFGNVGAQSSNIIPSIAQFFAAAPALPLRLYMDVGTYDIPVLIPRVRDFVQILTLRQYDVLYREYNEGHSWGNWRAHIDDMLIRFLGHLVNATDATPPAPEMFGIGAPWPNPARDLVSIPLTLPAAMPVQLTLYDSLGRSVRVLSERSLSAGTHTLESDVRGLAPGTYHLRATAGTRVAGRLLHLY
ncbi:MAG TPA: alpha/beta hydrolase-fold protein [Bacteroidota bacterium]|nr:alpha/beta hydrolase-fold protein [Bacteroidota bacterium]